MTDTPYPSSSPLPGDPNQVSKDAFMYPYYSPASESTTFPELIFDANLQEFSQRVAIICALETNGKLTPVEAYEQIKMLWTALDVSKRTLLG
jgi:hypothetical protein